MNYLKKLGTTIGIMALILFIATFFITTLNYFNLISGSFLSILEILIIISLPSETVNSITLKTTFFNIFITFIKKKSQ